MPAPPPLPVLLLVRELGIGGCERDLAKLARALDRSQFEPHVACFHPNGLRAPELRAAQVPILHLPLTSFASSSAFDSARRMSRYLRERRIGLVQAFDTPTDIFAVPVARWNRVPVIASHLWYTWIIPPLHRFLLRRSERMADLVVANSHAVARHLIEEEGLPAAKVRVSHNGVETEVFHPGPAERPASLAHAGLVIGSVCALRREKRIDLVIDAFAKVRRPGVQLLIAGSGAQREQLGAQAQALGIAGQVHFEPQTADVAPWMRAIDIFVAPSDSESFPNALLEAMACGCCPVATRVGGVPELIEDGVHGRLIDPGDRAGLQQVLGELIEQPERRREMAQAAARKALDFAMPRAAERMQAIYRELAGGPKYTSAVR